MHTQIQQSKSSDIQLNCVYLNIPLIAMLQLQHYPNNFQLTNY